MGICCQEEKQIKKQETRKKSLEDNDDSEKLKEKRKKKKEIKKKENENEDVNEINNKNKNKEIKKIANQMNEEQTKIYLEGLFKSYYSAKTYFNENELKDKELEAINCCKKIISAQEMLKDGKYKEINIGELPPKMTPEFITGYTPEKRKEKILEIIKKFNEEKEETRRLLNLKIDQMKKNFNKLKDSDKARMKQILDQDKNHIDSISKEVEKIKKTLVSDYIPIPLCITTSQACKKEKLNLDIEENTMKIKVNGITNRKSNPIVILGIHGDKINIEKELKGKTQDDIYEEFLWEFSEDQFKSLVKYNLQIALGKKEKGEVQLRKLKDTSSLYESVRLKTESGKSDTNIEIEIHLRSPLIDKEYDDDYRDIIKIVKIYPQFVFKE